MKIDKWKSLSLSPGPRNKKKRKQKRIRKKRKWERVRKKRRWNRNFRSWSTSAITTANNHKFWLIKNQESTLKWWALFSKNCHNCQIVFSVLRSASGNRGVLRLASNSPTTAPRRARSPNWKGARRCLLAKLLDLESLRKLSQIMKMSKTIRWTKSYWAIFAHLEVRSLRILMSANWWWNEAKICI